MMSRTLLVSMMVAYAEGQWTWYPNWGTDGQSTTGDSSFSLIRTPPPVTCENENNFYQKNIGQALMENSEFDSSNIKVALGRNKRFIQVDQPFSHAANALSFSSLFQVGDAPEEDADAKASKLRAKFRSMKAWSEERVKQAESVRAEELKKEAMELEELKKSTSDIPIDVYYVNMDTARERKNCLERQFKDMPGQPEPKRWEALRFPDRCTKGMTHGKYEECLRESGLGDCLEAGIDYSATGTHGSQNRDENRIRSAVISNWCGHKRLFKQLEEERANGTAPEYVVILEDDVILDRKYFMKVLKDFALNYDNRDWDMIQLDPFGHKDRKDLIGHFRGKPIFKPAADSQCSAYWGFHAVMVKTAALTRVNKWMSTNQAVPIDWLPWRMPHVLAYSALVSRNPEAGNQGLGEVVVLPQYCSRKVAQSTIA